MSKLPPSFVELMENGSEEVRQFLSEVRPVTVSCEPEDVSSDAVENACWIWQGSVLKREGYGMTGGVLVHRCAYELFHGDIPNGKKVVRTCDSRLCVNPRHLILASAAETAARLDSQAFRNKLAPGQQEEIRLAVADGENQTDVARRYGVSTATVSLIKHGKTSGVHRRREAENRPAPRHDRPFIPATAQQLEQAEEHPALSLAAWLDLQERRLGPVGQLARGEAMSDEQRDRAFSKATKEFTVYQLLSREYEARRSEAC